MAVEKVGTQAVRLNGYTDGLVVPTGAFRETGIDLFPTGHAEKKGITNKVTSYNSDEPKIGQRHIPNEGNPLNNLIGPFTIEAYVIPDSGGVIVHKEGCYTLKFGNIRKTGNLTFSVLTRNAGNSEAIETLTIPHLFSPRTDHYQIAAYNNNAGLLPHDLALATNPLFYINAQFTGEGLRVFVNGELFGELDFGGETRTTQAFSSDLYIGGTGGQYRGIIESVRISRGIVAPQLQPFTKTQDTIGLWNFEDEIDVPNLFFFNNKAPAFTTQIIDGTGDEDTDMPLPMVCVAYDFTNIAVTQPVTNPISLATGMDYGTFKIRNHPFGKATALELIASYLLKIPVEELPLQTWWNSGVLDIGTIVTKDTYHTDGLPVTSLNAIVNTSGTDPITGLPFTSYSYNPIDDDTDGGISLEPIGNPIERVRIIALDFQNDRVVVQNSILIDADIDDDPHTQGFLFEHSDNTLVWFTLGNGDLIIDNGGKLRKKGQMTRARFTQGQFFMDGSGFGNDAYWVSKTSRNTEANRTTPTAQTGIFNPADVTAPFMNDLILWLDGNDPRYMFDAQGQQVGKQTLEVSWWKSKSTLHPEAVFYSGPMFMFPWIFVPNNPSTNGLGSLKAAALSDYTSNQNGQPNVPFLHSNEMLEAWEGEFSEANPPLQPNEEPLRWGAPRMQRGQGILSGWVNKFGSRFGMTPFDPNNPNGYYGYIPSLPSLVPQGKQQFSAFHHEINHTNGKYTFIFVITPAPYSTQTPANLHNAITPDLNARVQQINAGFPASNAGPDLTTDGFGPVSLSTNGTPVAGTPTMVAIECDPQNGVAGVYSLFTEANGNNPAFANTFSGNPGASRFKYHPVLEDPQGNWPTGNPQSFSEVFNAGINLFGHITSGRGMSFTGTCPSGFLIHEILFYRKRLDQNEMADVRQYVEDKWGI